MKIEPPFCCICGDPIAGSVEHHFTCYSCSAEPPSFNAARSAARYDGVVGQALRKLKYEHALWLAPDIATLLYNCLKAEYSNKEFDFIIPVPLYHVRRRERSYNQSAIIAKELARKLKLKNRSKLLQRIRPTTSQTNLTLQGRLSNVGGAFRCERNKQLAGKTVLLVDDVMTTGATVNSCAKALKKGGVAAVYVITAARG